MKNTPAATNRPWVATAVAGSAFISWASIEIYRCLNHGMWRDEVNPWLYGLYSASPIDLYVNCRSESHPMAWFLLSWVVAQLTKEAIGIQILNLICMIAGMGLIFFKSRFTLLEKILLSLSYLLFFEYGVISRCYSLAFLAIALFSCARKAWWKYLWLGLLANTSFYGWIIALPLAAELLLSEWRGRRLLESIRDFGLYALFALVGVVSVIPTSDKHYGADWFFGWDSARLGSVLQVFDLTFFPVTLPRLQDSLKEYLGKLFSGYWPPQFYSLSAGGLIAVAVLILVLLGFLLWPNLKKIAVIYSGTLGVLAFSYCVHFSYIRHSGHLFLLLLACVWSTGRLGGVGRKIWIGILLVSAFGGVQSLFEPIRSQPFSQARNAGAFLLEQHLTDYPILGAADYVAMPVVGYAKVPIFMPSYGRYVTFMVDSLERNVAMSKEELSESIEKFVASNLPRPTVLLLNEPIESIVSSPKFKPQFLASFTGSYVGEDYFIYLAN